MKNRYTLSEDGTVATIWIDHKGKWLTCIIDAADLPKVESVPNRWHAQWNPNVRDFYIYCRDRSRGGRSATYIHRLITDAAPGLHVDHKYHRTRDNRRDYLEVTTPSGNLMNRRGADRCSTTGHRGVHITRSRKSPYRVTVRINGQPKYIGRFSTLDEALTARDKFPAYARKTLGHSEASL